MKKTFFRALLAAALTGGLFFHANAQGKMARVNASTSLEMYLLDPKTNAGELKKSKEYIDAAAAAADMQDDPAMWRTRGKVYSIVALDEASRKATPDAALTSYDAWMKAFQLEKDKLAAKNKPITKIGSKSEFKEGFGRLGNALFNSGADAIQAEKAERYANAYPYFSNIVALNALSTEVFGAKAVEFGFDVNDAVRLGGICAIKIGKLDEAEKALQPLLAAGTLKQEQAVSIYSSLADGYATAGNSAKAKSVLAEARKKYPADQNLLLTGINIAIREGKLAEMEGELQQAVAADPKNTELLFVMGNLYDGLFRDRISAGDKTTADNEKQAVDFMQKSVNWYVKATEVNPKHYNSVYSLGAIHLNLSNYLAKKVNNMASKDPNYAATEADRKKNLDKALQYLLEAEKIDPKELSVVIAIQEIYGRLNQPENYDKYKKRAAELRAGGK